MRTDRQIAKDLAIELRRLVDLYDGVCMNVVGYPQDGKGSTPMKGKIDQVLKEAHNDLLHNQIVEVLDDATEFASGDEGYKTKEELVSILRSYKP